jgi:hypothetical protein
MIFMLECNHFYRFAGVLQRVQHCVALIIRHNGIVAPVNQENRCSNSMQMIDG